MFGSNFAIRNAPRVEVDQRARQARLRQERVERLFMPRPAAKSHWIRWLICLSEVRFYAGARKGRTGGSLSDWRLSFGPA
jgi:hypothetical protein